MLTFIFIYFIIAVLLSSILTSKNGLPFSYWMQFTFVFPLALFTLGYIFYAIFTKVAQ